MKVPHIVSENTREAYNTSDFMRTSAGEVDRRLVAEDFEWDDHVTPSPLTFWAAEALSRIFDRLNPLSKVPQANIDMLMELYPTTIPLKSSVPLIEEELYWKRALAERFPALKELNIKFYKGRYLSACLQDYLEHVRPDIFLEDEALELAALVSPYIYELKLNQLQMVRQPQPPPYVPNTIEDTCPYSVRKVFDHIPLEPVLKKLYNLQEIALVFGVNNLEENYLTRYFEFSINDCKSLCLGLEHLAHFRVLRINRSNLDCSKVKVILENLVRKDSIEELDFNHCRIGNYGMKALGGFISLHKNLKVVKIANNRFKEEGVQGIAYALQMKPLAPLELVDLSLNQMSIECATMFAAAFVRCKDKPQTLILNSCGFRDLSAEKMVGMLCLNRSLRRLDLAANNLSGRAEQTLIEALEKNKKILTIDLRRTQISEETQTRVRELLERNEKLAGQETEPSDDIPPLYLNEPEYLIWEYNPNNPDYIPGRYPERIPEI